MSPYGVIKPQWINTNTITYVFDVIIVLIITKYIDGSVQNYSNSSALAIDIAEMHMGPSLNSQFIRRKHKHKFGL